MAERVILLKKYMHSHKPLHTVFAHASLDPHRMKCLIITSPLFDISIVPPLFEVYQPTSPSWTRRARLPRPPIGTAAMSSWSCPLPHSSLHPLDWAAVTVPR